MQALTDKQLPYAKCRATLKVLLMKKIEYAISEAELINRVSMVSGYERDKCKDVIDAFRDIIYDCMENGTSVTWNNVCKFNRNVSKRHSFSEEVNPHYVMNCKPAKKMINMLRGINVEE
jgi:nucleoid DNA-binding protein